MKTKLMKVIVAFVAVVITLMSATSPATAAEVFLYEHNDFQGRFQELSADAATSQPIDSQLSSQVSSLSVPSGATVMLLDSQTGASVTYTESAVYVGDEINDRADTVQIIPECPPGAEVC